MLADIYLVSTCYTKLSIVFLSLKILKFCFYEINKQKMGSTEKSLQPFNLPRLSVKDIGFTTRIHLTLSNTQCEE